jgi:DNA-binding CsgD family transcriptional regulator
MQKEATAITEESNLTSPLETLRRAIRKTSLAVALLHLPHRRFVEMSDSARCLLGLDSTELSYFDPLTTTTEPDQTYRLFGLITDGTVEGYRVRRTLRVGSAEVDMYIGVRVVARAGAAPPREAIAVVSYTDETPPAQSDDSVALGYSPELVLTSILEMVHPDDVSHIVEGFEDAAASTDGQAVVPVRCGSRRMWQRARLVIHYDAREERFGFTLAPSEGRVSLSDLDRASELERRLRRIADEVEAAGLFHRVARLPDPDRVPGLDALSARQWEIVTRLLRGERVPRIARAMYLSPSTVRNHLSTIFRKLGVHSQAELIDRLYPPD